MVTPLTLMSLHSVPCEPRPCFAPEDASLALLEACGIGAEALRPVRRLHLISGDGDRWRMHRLVRTWAVDSVAPARGFRLAGMGEVVEAPYTVSAHVPRPALLRLVRSGRLLVERFGSWLDFVAEEPGAYRVEALLPAYGKQRTWILSNPVYVR